MPGFSRRPLAILVCCLFSGTQTGYAAIETERVSLLATGSSSQDELREPLLLAANDTPLNLRKERKFNVLKKKKEPEDKTQLPKAPVPEARWC